MINEEFIQYIWKHKLFKLDNLLTVCGKTIEIINPGELNTNAGADFFNSKVKIENTLWAGNVEIHIKSSDWLAHNHQTDKAYSNVILHVVTQFDQDAINQKGEVIPCLEIKYSEDLYDEYLSLTSSVHDLACASHLHQINSFEISLWVQRMLVERLEHKVNSIEHLLNNTTNNWDEVFYRLLFRSFGLGVNGTAFELLAQSIPLSVLLKYSNDIDLLEALLFGQAGMLSEPGGDNYYARLQTDYQFLKQKHGLKPMDSFLWKFLRLRPSNFPTIRISQLANLMHKLKGVFGNLTEEQEIRNIEKLLNVDASVYWDKHYTFSKESKDTQKRLGKTSISNIIINTIIPYIFTFGKKNGNVSYEQKALKWLSEMKPERNSIINQWKCNEIPVKSAGDSQALIYLFNNYCKLKKCLHCRIGHQVLAIK
ncbi:DUF2851 family protein [Saccharicrinis aurantiacus]|uniref:DUF2851 family protein n=1 Tax=Saccharicrinis aurantiacus TaxID=1849719 RepID=UPI002490F7C2|nr:DUF2851 family protein [Saccharicrinis aurantiacus]